MSSSERPERISNLYATQLDLLNGEVSAPPFGEMRPTAAIFAPSRGASPLSPRLIILAFANFFPIPAKYATPIQATPPPMNAAPAAAPGIGKRRYVIAPAAAASSR